MVTLETCHEIAGKGVVPFEKMDKPQLIKGFSDQIKVENTHFLVSVVESTPFGEHFGLLDYEVEPGSDRVGVGKGGRAKSCQ